MKPSRLTQAVQAAFATAALMGPAGAEANTASAPNLFVCADDAVKGVVKTEAGGLETFIDSRPASIHADWFIKEGNLKTINVALHRDKDRAYSHLDIGAGQKTKGGPSFSAGKNSHYSVILSAKTFEPIGDSWLKARDIPPEDLARLKSITESIAYKIKKICGSTPVLKPSHKPA